jgi:hypothetical protein
MAHEVALLNESGLIIYQELFKERVDRLVGSMIPHLST